MCTAHISILALKNTLACRSDKDFRTVFKQERIKPTHYCSININCCINTWEYLGILDSHDKRKLSNGQLWKFWKETAVIELCSLSIDILAFELGKLCPGVRILFRFFDTEAGVLH